MVLVGTKKDLRQADSPDTLVPEDLPKQVAEEIGELIRLSCSKPMQ